MHCSFASVVTTVGKKRVVPCTVAVLSSLNVDIRYAQGYLSLPELSRLFPKIVESSRDWEKNYVLFFVG